MATSSTDKPKKKRRKPRITFTVKWRKVTRTGGSLDIDPTSRYFPGRVRLQKAYTPKQALHLVRFIWLEPIYGYDVDVYWIYCRPKPRKKPRRRQRQLIQTSLPLGLPQP